MHIRFLIIFAALITFSACANAKPVGQGGSFEVVSADGNNVEVKYDPTLKTPAQIVKMVGLLCSAKRVNGNFTPVKEEKISPNITHAHYQCVGQPLRP